MPYPNEHACRIEEPGAFQPDSFRRVERKHEGKPYAVIIGRRKGETTTSEQAYRYPKDTWTASAARAHCKSHDGGSFEKAAPVEDQGAAPVAETVVAAAPPCRCHDAGAPVTLETVLGARPAARRPAAAGGRLELVAQASGPAELYVYASVGGFFGLDVNEIIAAITALPPGTPLRVHLNSPGGSVFDGLALYHTLRQHSGPVETIVEGLAASIASIIALAGSPVTMAAESLLMIHEPHAVAIGDAHEMRAMAALLEKTGGLLADVYEKKTGAARDQVRRWMHAETWFTATEAFDAGFVDQVSDLALPADARALAAQFDLSAFQHPPQLPAPPPPAPPAPAVAVRAPQREALRALHRLDAFLV